MLNYGRSFFYVRDSDVNRLFIDVDSRIQLSDPAEEYLLLAPHPREQTFLDNGQIYSGMLAAEQGASDIIFIADQPNNRAIVSRRYDVPGQPDNYRRQVGASPYSGPLHNPPEHVAGVELYDYADIRGAADAGRKMVATVEYTLHGRNVLIEFPVRVLNMNPAPAVKGKQWQIASPMVPVFIGSGDPDQRIRPGYLAFGRLGANVAVSMVYIIDAWVPRQTQDFSASLNQVSTVRLFAMGSDPIV